MLCWTSDTIRNTRLFQCKLDDQNFLSLPFCEKQYLITENKIIRFKLGTGGGQFYVLLPNLSYQVDIGYFINLHSKKVSKTP